MTNTIQICLFLLLITFFGLSAASAQLIGSTLEEARAAGKAEFVYVYNDVTDFAKQDVSGEVQGLLIDLMREFEKYVLRTYELPVTVKFLRVSDHKFKEFLETVQGSSGGVFGLSNTSITPQRLESFQFSLPYIENISILVSEANIPDLASFDEIEETFSSKRAFSVASSTYLTRLLKIREEHFPGLEIELVNSGLDVMKRVSEDTNSFAIVDLLYYLEYYKKGYPIKRHQVGDLSGDQFGIIMPLSNDWNPVLDEFLKTSFIGTPAYRKVISNHLGKSAIRLIPNITEIEASQSNFK